MNNPDITSTHGPKCPACKCLLIPTIDVNRNGRVMVCSKCKLRRRVTMAYCITEELENEHGA